MRCSGLILPLLLASTLANAEIFECRDKFGNIVLKDTECTSDSNVIRPHSKDNASKQETPPAKKTPTKSLFEDNKPGKIIFSNKRPLSPPYRIKVNEARVITETDDTLVVDVLYTYEHRIPADQMKIYVKPNHGYWSTNSIQVERGYQVGRARIGLSPSNMKRDRVKKSSTDTIMVSFEHYSPRKYKGVIWSETIKFNKDWKLK